MAGKNRSRLDAVRARNAMLGGNPDPSPIIGEFTFADWMRSARMREAADYSDAANRFDITLIAPDGAPRHYKLTGSLESVLARAREFFETVQSLTLTPGNTRGPELIDKRKFLSTT